MTDSNARRGDARSGKDESHMPMERIEREARASGSVDAEIDRQRRREGSS